MHSKGINTTSSLLKLTHDASDDDITQFFEVIRNIPSCTSIHWFGPKSIPANIELPPNILSVSIYNGELSTEQQDTLERNRSQLTMSKRTTVEFSSMGVSHKTLFPASDGSSFTLRFFGPPSGNLTLRLIHRSRKKDQSLKVESQDFTHLIPHSDSFVLEDIPIVMQGDTPSPTITFIPGSPNTLTFIFMADDYEIYYLRDIELLDENMSPYHPINAAPIDVFSESDID